MPLQEIQRHNYCCNANMDFVTHSYGKIAGHQSGPQNTITLAPWILAVGRSERHSVSQIGIHGQAQHLSPCVVSHSVEIKLRLNNFTNVQVSCEEGLAFILGACQHCPRWRMELPPGQTAVCSGTSMAATWYFQKSSFPFADRLTIVSPKADP